MKAKRWRWEIAYKRPRVLAGQVCFGRCNSDLPFIQALEAQVFHDGLIDDF